MAGSSNDLWFQCPAGELLRLRSRLRWRRWLHYAAIAGVTVATTGSVFGGYQAITWFSNLSAPTASKVAYVKPDGTPCGQPVPIQTHPLPAPPKDKPR